MDIELFDEYTTLDVLATPYANIVGYISYI